MSSPCKLILTMNALNLRYSKKIYTAKTTSQKKSLSTMILNQIYLGVSTYVQDE